MLMFVNRLGLSLLIPVLPFIVRDYAQSDFVYGLLLSAYSGFVFIGSPILGNLSDRFGRKPTLVISQAGTLVSWIIFGLAYFLPGNLWPILVIAFSRVVDGITGGNVSVANAYLSDVTTPKERTRAFSYLIAASGTAFIIGPSIGSFSNATRYGYVGTAVTATLISTVTLLAIIFYLDESLPAEKRSQLININPLYQLNMLARIRELRNRETINWLFGARLFVSLTMSAYAAIIVLYVIDLFHFDEQELGFFLFFVGTFLIINQLLVFPFFARRFHDLTILLIGMVTLAVGLILITRFRTMVPYVLSYYVVNLGLSLCLPTIKSLLTKVSDEGQQGIVMGIDESILALMGAIAPSIAGLMYARLFNNAFVFIAIWMLAGFLLTFLARDKIRSGKPAGHPQAKYPDYTP